MPHSIATLGPKAIVAHGSKLFLIDEHKILNSVDLGNSHIDNLTTGHGKILGVNHGDKTVVVFDESLKELRRYAFPKRPSSLAFKDESSVLVADKFGDVYDLDLTKEPTAEFSLTPVLGHVSMLLKVVVANQKILTADRDEHIKVSSLLNPYNILGFCFGHTHYVSDLCVVGDYLLSAGGDSFIAKWSLDSYEEICRLDLTAFFDHTEFNVLRLIKYDDTSVLCIFQESPVILKIDIDTMQIDTQYNLPDYAVDIAAGDKVWVALKDSVVLTDLEQTVAFPEAFGDSEIKVLMQHEMRKRAEH